MVLEFAVLGLAQSLKLVQQQRSGIMECALLSSSHEGTDLQIHSLGKIDGLSMGKSGQKVWR